MPSCGVCLSVCLFVDHVKTNKHLRNFAPSSSHAVLVFLYQTGWRYFDGNPLTGASNAGGVGKKRDSGQISGFAAYRSTGQKTVKTAKMTIGVPIVTCLHRVRRIHYVRVRVRVRRIHKAAKLLSFWENCVFAFWRQDPRWRRSRFSCPQNCPYVNRRQGSKCGGGKKCRYGPISLPFPFLLSPLRPFPCS